MVCMWIYGISHTVFSCCQQIQIFQELGWKVEEKYKPNPPKPHITHKEHTCLYLLTLCSLLSVIWVQLSPCPHNGPLRWEKAWRGWLVLWFGLALIRTGFTRAGASLYKILTSCRAHRSLKDKQQACGERELSGQENPLHIIPHQPLLTSASQRFLSCEGIPPEGPETINDRNTVEFYFGIECDSFVDLV